MTTNNVLSKAGLHRYHTALRFRCGGNEAAAGGNTAAAAATSRRLVSGLWRAKAPFWTAASSSCLFQSTAAAPETAPKPKPKTSSPSLTKILADDPDFVKPDPDVRQYRWIQLANNLQVLLVSTTTSNAAASESEEETLSHVEAASVHVQAGHFDDTIPGVSQVLLILCGYYEWLTLLLDSYYAMGTPLTTVLFFLCVIILTHAIHPFV